MNRHFCSCAILSLACLHTVAQGSNTVSAHASLQSVVVYRSGAELAHAVAAFLPAGPVDLAVDGVSTSLDVNSVQVGLPASVTLLGITYQEDFLTPQPKSAGERLLEDSLDRLRDAREALRLSLANTTSLLEVLNKNRELKGSQTGMNVADLEKFMDYYEAKAGALTGQEFRLEKKDSLLRELMNRLQRQIDEESTKNAKVSGRLVLRLLVSGAGNCDFAISYLSRMAGWSPEYELRAGDSKDSIQVAYKASLEQSTGLDWKQVRLSLSTSLPSEWNQAPVLNPDYLSFAPLEVSNAKAFFDSGNLGMGAPMAKGLAKGVALPEEQRLNVVYHIDYPYDLPSTGGSQALTLQTQRYPAVYTYLAVPKLSDEAYLLADLPGWGSLDLLPGKARIILDGTYVGTTTIDPSSTEDTLHLTLGADKRITIRRRQVTDLGSEKFLNSNRYQACGYEIAVRNNKPDAIHLVVEDQIPVSTDKAIVVSPDDLGGARLDAGTGELDWDLDLKPGESRQVRFGYTLKYPKDQRLAGR